MPIYSSTTPCTSISPSDTLSLWSTESPNSGDASVRFTLAAPYGDSVSAISVFIKFSADPGAFEIDVQDADIDAATNYLPVPVGAAITSVDGTNFTARAEFSPFAANFGRLFMKTKPANAVTVSAWVTMQ